MSEAKRPCGVPAWADGLLDDYDPMPSLIARGIVADPAEHTFVSGSDGCVCDDCNEAAS